MDSKRYRVAVWGTGNAGMHCLQSVIQHPRYDLVGCWVYSDSKAGRDAGELCGLGPVGVTTTQDIETIIAAKPDCVVHMADQSELNVICRLLEAGCNIVTARVEFNFRDTIPEETRHALEDACRRGNSSLYSTGSNPGWFTEQLLLSISALHRRIDSIELFEYHDMTLTNTPHMLFDILPFGWDPTKKDIALIPTPQIAPGSLTMTAAALGLGVQEMVTTRDFALTRERVEIPAGVLEKGTIGAMRRSISGMCDGKMVIRRTSTLFVCKDVEPDFNLRPSGYYLHVEGDPCLDVTFAVPMDSETRRDGATGLTSNPVINSVPYVCAAAPGIVHTSELPPIIGWFGD